MNDLLNQVLGNLGPDAITSISKQIGTKEEETTNALSGVLPTLLGAMANNAKSAQGAQGLLGALDKDHDGSILDNVGDFLGNYQDGPGEGILKHVLGDKRPTVENNLSQKTGLNSNQIGDLLKIAAPLIMGYLGKQKKQAGGNGFDISSISGLLGGMTKQADNSTGLDLGDVLNIVGGLTGGQQSQGGLGGMLGKLFGK
jgi:hypothetical protein